MSETKLMTVNLNTNSTAKLSVNLVPHSNNTESTTIVGVQSVNNIKPDKNGNVFIEIPMVSNEYDSSSTNAMSGIAVAIAMRNKQDALNKIQMDAVNSGVTSKKISTYDKFLSYSDRFSEGINIVDDGNNNIRVESIKGRTELLMITKTER